MKHRQKKYPPYLVTGLVLLIIAVSLVLTGCDTTNSEGEPEPERPTATSDALGILPIFTVDNNGTHLETVANIDPATVLYDIRNPKNVVTGPDGNSITWDEWDNVTGSATVECVDGGTRFSLGLDGLIPGGLYTIWNVVLHEPGIANPPTLNSLVSSIVGVAPLGAPDGSENSFRASTNGTAKITEITLRAACCNFRM